MATRTRAVALALAAALGAALEAPLARAAAPAVRASELDRVRALIEAAEFDEALQQINDALAQPDNSDAHLAALYELQGTTYLYQGRESLARTAFERLLQAAPDHQLARGTSPKIRKLFESVREDALARRVQPVRIFHEALKSAPPRERLDVPATIEDLPASARARLYYRRGGTEAFSSASFAQERGARYVARVPAFELPAEERPWALEYYLEVTDAAGRRLAGVGDALQPLLLRVSGSADSGAVAAAQEDPWYRKWWVWTLGGVAVAGAGAAVAIPLLTGQKQARLPVTIRIQP